MPLIRIASKVFGSSFRQKMLSMTALGLMAAATHAQTAAPAVSTIVAFNVSKLLGYVPRSAKFSMQTRRFYSADALRLELTTAGLKVCAQRERPILPGRSLVVAGWSVEPDA